MRFPLCKFGSAFGMNKILQDNRIFISSPLDLNDSFEMRPAWTQPHEDFAHGFRVRKEVMLAGGPDYDIVDGKIVEIWPEETEFAPKMDVRNQNGLADENNRLVARYLHATYRSLSLVRRVIDTGKKFWPGHQGDVLMWAHYADMFQGAAILLDPRYFNNGLANPSGQRGFTINYRKDRVALPVWFYPYLQNFPIDVSDEMVEELDKAATALLTTKSPRWMYEREIRMLYPMDLVLPHPEDFPEFGFPCPDCNGKPEEQKAECQNKCYRDFVTLPEKAIVGVIFGPECPENYTEPLLETLADPRYEHVKLFWSTHNGQEYQIDYMKTEASTISTYQKEHTKRVGLAKHHYRNTDTGMSMMRFGSQKGINLNPRSWYEDERFWR